jgi:hypothetical protein
VAQTTKSGSTSLPRYESLISQSLDRIAAILLRAGIDSPAAEQLLRRAFISAASRIAVPGKRKATQSQIAALAGVSRLEVRRELTRANTGAQQNETNTRIALLVNAWRSDPKFSTRVGAPRALQFHGSNSEFDALVRKYGRDVTKKTILVQLVMLGLAKERNGTLHLIRKTPSAYRSAAASSDLKFVASQLTNIDFELGRREYATRRVAISTKERKSAEAIRRIALSRLDTVMNSLESISVLSRHARKRKRDGSHRLLVSTTVAMESGESE